jgi:hypothetical protein
VKAQIGIWTAPLAWFLDLQVSYASVKWVCEHDLRALQLLLPLASVALLGCGAALSWSAFNAVRERASEDGALLADRNYFLALGGLMMSALFALLIVNSYFGRVLLSPCE